MQTKDDTAAKGDLAPHLETSLETLAQVHIEHYRSAPPLQRLVDRVTETLGRPTLAIATIAALTAAAVVSAVTVSADHSLFDALEFAATLASLCLALLILVTQRRDDQLGESRAKLTLELALLADQRTAKLIALLEEMRRDSPVIADRVDAESDEMAAPTDPRTVMDAIAARAPGGAAARDGDLARAGG